MKMTCPLCGSKEAEDWAVTVKCPTEGCRNSYQPLIDAKKKSKIKLELELEIEELERQIDPIYFGNTAVNLDDFQIDFLDDDDDS